MKNMFFFIPILLLAGCRLTPERVSFDDPKLQPLFSALSEIDRDSLGFTAIVPADEIRIEEPSFIDTPYDIMLHVYGKSSRTISFVRDGNDYRWVGEQEIHTGPRAYETPDGIFNESLTITFETIPIAGHQLNTPIIHYLGPASFAHDLTLEQAREMIEHWKKSNP